MDSDFSDFESGKPEFYSKISKTYAFLFIGGMVQ